MQSLESVAFVFLFARIAILDPEPKKIRSLVLDCLSSFVILFSSRGIIPLPKMDWEFYEIFLWKIETLSSCTGHMCIPQFPVLLELHQSVPE